MVGGGGTKNGDGKSLDAANGFTGVVEVIDPVPSCNGTSFDPPFNHVLRRVTATAAWSASSSESCNEPSEEWMELRKLSTKASFLVSDDSSLLLLALLLTLIVITVGNMVTKYQRSMKCSMFENQLSRVMVRHFDTNERL